MLKDYRMQNARLTNQLHDHIQRLSYTHTQLWNEYCIYQRGTI